MAQQLVDLDHDGPVDLLSQGVGMVGGLGRLPGPQVDTPGGRPPDAHRGAMPSVPTVLATSGIPQQTPPARIGAPITNVSSLYDF